MMNKIFVSGGSHCIGGGFNWSNVIEIYKQNGYDIKNRYDITYAKILANHFNFDIIFEGEFGGSVNRMVRKTYEYIFQNRGNETLFIFEVPPGWRDEFHSNELKRLVNMTIGNIYSPHDETDVSCGHNPNDMILIHKNITNYFYNFVDYDFDVNKWMLSLFGLISYIKLKNYKYILIDSGDFQKFLRKNNENESEYNFLWFDKGNAMNNWINDHELTIKKETNGLSNDEHLSIHGHKLVAEKIINYINENKTFFS